MVYHIMFRDEPVLDIEVDNKNRVVRWEKFVPDGMKQPIWGDNINTMRLYDFLKSRCYEDGRSGLTEILTEAGMETNNPYEWVRVCHGVTWEDFFWVKIDDEDISWDEVRVR